MVNTSIINKMANKSSSGKKKVNKMLRIVVNYIKLINKNKNKYILELHEIANKLSEENNTGLEQTKHEYNVHDTFKELEQITKGYELELYKIATNLSQENNDVHNIFEDLDENIYEHIYPYMESKKLIAKIEKNKTKSKESKSKIEKNKTEEVLKPINSRFNANTKFDYGKDKGFNQNNHSDRYNKMAMKMKTQADHNKLIEDIEMRAFDTNEKYRKK